MIKSIKFKTGYPLDVMDLDGKKHLLRDKIEFTDGINVLYGPNGCGKSTVINALGIYGLTKGGYSNLNFAPYMFPSRLDNDKSKYNTDALAKEQYGFTAEVEIDGPVYKLSDIRGTGNLDDFMGESYEKHGFGPGATIGTNAMLMRMESSRQSEGERRMVQQGRELLNLIDHNVVFDIEKFNDSTVNNKEFLGELRKYAEKTVLKGGKPTVILDEPEDHLSLEHKHGLFTNLIWSLEDEGYQVILASHYNLLPFYDRYHFIELGTNVDAIRKFITHLTVNGIKGEYESPKCPYTYYVIGEGLPVPGIPAAKDPHVRYIVDTSAKRNYRGVFVCFKDEVVGALGGCILPGSSTIYFDFFSADGEHSAEIVGSMVDKLRESLSNYATATLREDAPSRIYTDDPELADYCKHFRKIKLSGFRRPGVKNKGSLYVFNDSSFSFMKIKTGELANTLREYATAVGADLNDPKFLDFIAKLTDVPHLIIQPRPHDF